MKYLLFIVILLLLAPFSGHAFETRAREAIALDYETGATLFSKEADTRTYPASMTKMMTAYILFKRLADGDISMDDRFTVSERAWRQQGSKMFVELNNRIRVEDLLQGIVVSSGNDACIVVAEALAGSTEQFAALMNETAAKLGMTGTHFTNPDGWPDDNHYTTVHDLARLSQHLIADFPQYYHYWAQPSFTYHTKQAQHNRNRLLYRNIGVDGLKTGHTEIAGYGIAVSGKNAAGRRVVVVVHGLGSEDERETVAAELYTYALASFDNDTVLTPGLALGEAAVWYGAKPAVALTVAEEKKITLPKVGRDQTEFLLSYKAPLAAPVAKGTPVGELLIRAPGMSEQRVRVVTAEDVPPVGFTDRALMNLKMLLGGQ